MGLIGSGFHATRPETIKRYVFSESLEEGKKISRSFSLSKGDEVGVNWLNRLWTNGFILDGAVMIF